MKLFFHRVHLKAHHWFALLLIPVIYLQWQTLTLVRKILSSNGPNSDRHETSSGITVDITERDFDQHVLKYIQARHILHYDPNAPTSYTGSRKTWRNYMELNWTQKMGKIVAKKMAFTRDGFFVECGALDGAYLSKTLLLERILGWTGLLVEPDPSLLPVLTRRNRRAYISNACLSTELHPMRIEINSHKNGGHEHVRNNITGRDNPETRDIMKDSKRKFQAQCFPLWMLMAAINRTKIDYLSLDVGGTELDILRTIPFDKLSIKLISVEVRPGNKPAIQQFLESVGYKRINQLDIPSDYMYDDLYELQQTK